MKEVLINLISPFLAVKIEPIILIPIPFVELEEPVVECAACGKPVPEGGIVGKGMCFCNEECVCRIA